MPWWIHTVAGCGVAAVMAAAAWRLASRTVRPDALLRVLAAAVWWWIGAQTAGLFSGVAPGGLSATAFVAALLPAAAVLRWVPRGAGPARTDPAGRAALAAGGVGATVLAALVLARPALGLDGLLYHLALPAAWVGDGRLAGLPHVTGIPVEAYPVGVELGTAWLALVTGATAAAVLVPAAALGLATVAVWTLTRCVGGSVPAAWGAVASTALATPFAVGGAQLSTDLPAAAFVAAGVALVVSGGGRRTGAGGRRDDVDSVALLTGAAGLSAAVGMKTSAACGVLVLVVVAWPVRRTLVAHLRAERLWGMALGLAAVCGGVWLARNAVLHGHPSWPLLATSFGDPVPAPLVPFDARFLDHPIASLRVGGGDYLRLAWPVLPLAALSLVALRSSGPARTVALAGILGGLAWTAAPATGILVDAELAAGATRYLMPCWVLLAPAAWSRLPSRPGPVGRRVVVATVVLVAVAQLVVLWTQPGARTEKPLDRMPLEQAFWAALAGIAAIGAATALGAGPRGRRLPHVSSRTVATAVAALAALAFLPAVSGFWDRHAVAVDTDAPPASGDVVLALASAPAWALGAHARPGAVVVPDCRTILAGFLGGRTVTLGPSVPFEERCGIPAEPGRIVDGYRVFSP